MIRGPNKVREKLAAGRLTVGSAIYSWSANAMEVAGLAGLDFMRIDTEHAWRRDGGIEPLIRAAALTGVVPIMRIDGGDPFLAMKAFEAGAGGIIVTEVETVETAREVVRRAKFPPNGSRGYSGNCWSAGWGAKAGAEWVEWSDRELLVGIMVENPDAMDRVGDILAVDGIDFALFGPADYSMGLGLRKPARDDARVQEALHLTVEAARAAGKHVMYNPGANPDDIKIAAGMGISMLEIGNDLGLLKSAWSKAAKLVSEDLKAVEKAA